jgi:hypothetical protein
MQLKPKGKRSDHYSEIEDPRIERSKRHKLIALLLLLKAITVSKLRHSFANWGDSTPLICTQQKCQKEQLRHLFADRAILCAQSQHANSDIVH